MTPLLQVDRLQVSFFPPDGEVNVVRELSFDIARGETLALVGESGCGKSVTALAIMGLLDYPGRIVGGEVRLGGELLSNMDEAHLRKVRGARIGMVFQEPMTSLNPVFSVGRQLGEVLRLHLGYDDARARHASVELLERVRIPAAASRLQQYPHELSGGMKQRVMIAIALACEPRLLIADEPTTALDVTIQAQILDLLHEIQQEMGLGVLLITHNLGVVAQFAQRVAVMYAGQLAELAPVAALFERPQHPYTQALLRSLPGLVSPGEALNVIAGTVPAPRDFAAGCRFVDRCGERLARCAGEVPPIVGARDHTVACWQRTAHT